MKSIKIGCCNAVTVENNSLNKWSSINDVIVMLFVTRALVLSSQNLWPPAPKTVKSFMDDPLSNFVDSAY